MRRKAADSCLRSGREPSRVTSATRTCTTDERCREEQPRLRVKNGEGSMMERSAAISRESLGRSRDGLEDLCINAIRMLSIDAVQQANSGHPGMPMCAATMA